MYVLHLRPGPRPKWPQKSFKSWFTPEAMDPMNPVMVFIMPFASFESVPP